MVKEALKEIEKHSAPGSYIVANNRARCCNFESLQELKQYKVISVEQLQKFDPPGKNKLLNNLGMCMLFFFFFCIIKYLISNILNEMLRNDLAMWRRDL